MVRKVVLVHGRAQEGKDAVGLKHDWLSHLHEGMRRAGIPDELDESRFSMLYYGDTLLHMTTGTSAKDAPKIKVRGQSSDELGYKSFAEAFVRDIHDFSGVAGIEIPPAAPRTRGVLNWPWVQASLRVLDQHSSAISDLSVSQLTKDVYAYLTNPEVSEALDMGLMEAIGDSPDPIIVSHSLGTIIAYNVLKKRPELKVPLFVTLGSPLGIGAVKRRIAPILYPGGVGKWVNAYDKKDVVSLFPLDSVNFMTTPPIENDGEVDNLTENRHGISGYLSHPPIAEAIVRAMPA